MRPCLKLRVPPGTRSSPPRPTLPPLAASQYDVPSSRET